MQNLKSKYEHQEMNVSEGLWDRLEAQLDQLPAKERKPKMVWLRYAAIIVLMIGLEATFLMFNDKSETNKNRELANQTNLIEPSEQKVPVKKNSEDGEQTFAVENVNPSAPVRDEIPTQSLIPEKELIIKKEVPHMIPESGEELAQTDIQKPREKIKYVSSSDLLFGVEIDKAKTETPKSAMGINTPKIKNESDFPNPKRIKLFGITLYDKDSTTTK